MPPNKKGAYCPQDKSTVNRAFTLQETLRLLMIYNESSHQKLFNALSIFEAMSPKNLPVHIEILIIS